MAAGEDPVFEVEVEMLSKQYARGKLREWVAESFLLKVAALFGDEDDFVWGK